MSKTNRQSVLASRLSGYLKESDFGLVESPVSKPSEGQLLVRTIFLSVAPHMQGRMNNNRGSYEPPVENGQVMTSGIASEVVKVNPDIASISIALGILGMPGLTAYFGLFDICPPKLKKLYLYLVPQVLIVGQLAKIEGCRAVGIAGTGEK